MTLASRRALLGALAAVPLLGRRAFAQDKATWPDRPIRLVVPFGAGTTTDALGRILADALAKEAGQPVVVENRAGAGGNVGAQAVAQAPGDGYTLLLGTNGTHGINSSLFPNLGFDPVKDFTPIAPYVTTPSVLGVPVALKANSLAELIALAKAKPLSFASAGNGTTGHLSQALFNLRAGLETQHIPYRNASQAITDLIAGRVDAMFYHPLGLKPHLEAGTLKALAVTSPKRISILPDVPTMQEGGVQDFVVEGRWSVYGPAGMPAEIVARLNRTINALLADPEALAHLRMQGVEPVGGSPEQLAAMTRDEIAKWRPVIAAANIRPD
ncbi:tripartite tricarboxylate transporter substrate binding protein [Roseomonas sp. E05]|uniref:Bug family tripartite tricarboxylate transporter substrate binding protein n=1 Tax=Roseomonas sp. E05 TaxID=3046310 RepID=UPI0024BA1D9D|nr:tripartite tricarboxylate transporter substrate binding protein [Roseomonas sp. E05]MDJ0386988.1 tripartite tricarboxylate transporter substrate binding protein [Roseomonas sp. E05]